MDLGRPYFPLCVLRFLTLISGLLVPGVLAAPSFVVAHADQQLFPPNDHFVRGH